MSDPAADPVGRIKGGLTVKVNNVTGAMGAYRQNEARKVSKTQEVSRPAKGDGVELSREAQEARSLKDKISQAPEVRQERIEELRRQIEAGTYRPDGREIAARMLQSQVFDKLG